MNIQFKVIIIINFIKLSIFKLIIPLKFININEKVYSEFKKDYLSRLYSSNLYINFTIGSNKEVIKGILNMSQVGFFIYENSYNYNISSSFMRNNKSQKFYKRNNEEGFISNDTICLNYINTFQIEKCKNDKTSVSFILLKSKQINIDKNIYDKFAIIGLQQNDYFDENIMPLFIHSLKKANIIDSYLFSFIFNKNELNDNIGYLLLGNEIKENNTFEIKKFSTVRKYGHPFWFLSFNQICVGLNNSYDTSKNNNFQKFHYTEVELVASLPYLVGIYEYNIYIKFNFFYNLLSEKICEYKSVPINPDFSTFVCDSKSKKFIEAFIKFPKLFFIHDESNTTFILDKNDLFSYNLNNKSDTYIYFLVLFYNHMGKYDEITKFKLGMPFFKKYNFSFNPDDRIINYYEKKIVNINDNKINLQNKEKDKTFIKIVIIFFLLIIFFVLGVLFHKNIVKLPRKKIANELEDEYEYKKNPILYKNKKNNSNNYDINKEDTKNLQSIEFRIKNIN